MFSTSGVKKKANTESNEMIAPSMFVSCGEFVSTSTNLRFCISPLAIISAFRNVRLVTTALSILTRII
jgi:hypothetical protein